MRFSRRGASAILGGVLLFVTVVGIGWAVWDLPDQSNPARIESPSGGETTLRFEEVAAEHGLEYTATNDQLAMFGNSRAGVYVTDFDNDGWPDVLATGGGGPVLFENDGGQFKPSDALPAATERPTNALFFDYDTDGWEDLLLFTPHGTPVFFENDGGEFERRDVGFDTNVTISNAATALDYNRDGCLDVFVAQTGDWRNTIPWKNVSGDAGIGENGEPNLLFEGDCSDFDLVTDAGIAGTHWSLAASAADLDGDGLVDVHVANDFGSDVLYRNRGDGTLERVVIPDTDRHGMASEVADVNGDGLMDVFVTNIYFHQTVWQVELSDHMDNSGNSLLVNQGNGTFASLESEYDVMDGGWGWAAGIVDYDNDGHEDLVHTTQQYVPYHESRAEKFDDRVVPPPRFWHGGDDGFEDANERRLGLAPSNGRGMGYLDYDRDGDQDLVVADMNESSSYKLYENTLQSDREWLQVRLQVDDRPVLASEVCVVADERTRCRPANAKADFLSQDTRVLHFGLGDVSSVTLRVTWPDGSVDTIEDVSTGRRVVVSPGGSISDDPVASG